MTDDDFNTINHVGMYFTRVQMRQDGSVVVVQTNKHGASDCVIIPADLVDDILNRCSPIQGRGAA